MSALVINSSVALSWCFEDEASPRSDALFEQVRDYGAVVPGLWHLEVANVLLQAEKRGRIATADVAVRLDLIADCRSPPMTKRPPAPGARSLRWRGRKD